MSATTTAERLLAIADRRMVDFDPDSGSEVLVTLERTGAVKGLPIALFRRWLFGIMRSIGTGGITAVRVLACTAADGTGAVAVASLTPTTADAQGDTIFAGLEVTAEQIREVLPTATHVCLGITLATSTDECIVYVEQAEPFFERSGLTANSIA